MLSEALGRDHNRTPQVEHLVPAYVTDLLTICFRGVSGFVDVRWRDLRCASAYVRDLQVWLGSINLGVQEVAKHL
jgi:hypothetical protein